MVEEIMLYGLAYECPYMRRKQNCPFSEVDHLTFAEKVKWIENLNQDIKKEIINQHQNCFMSKV